MAGLSDTCAKLAGAGGLSRVAKHRDCLLDTGIGVLHRKRERSDEMNTHRHVAVGQDLATRCHIWQWAAGDAEWERRNLVVGGLSPLGLVAAAATAAASGAANRRRREAAIREAAPRWRYVSSGTARLLDGQLTVVEPSGITRTLDLRGPVVVEEPTTGWISWRQDGGDHAWAVQFMS